jgi:hypothetical protein
VPRCHRRERSLQFVTANREVAALDAGWPVSVRPPHWYTAQVTRSVEGADAL